MNREFFFIILIAVMCSICPAVTEYRQCQVDSVLSVYGSGSFVCRVTDWPHVGAVRLRVSVRGLEGVSGESAGATNAALLETLSKSSNIKLSNLKVGAGFRVVADVEADGFDVASLLTGAKQPVAVESIAPAVKVEIKPVIAKPVIQREPS